ncbi:C45 family autoproteolytic acyltransferase/hydrolase [Leptolyngbya sp. AN02str]|uniref:C45 family autoproteolytic acyltransferase/hydolase n=1 Tax=Leptolyngbya sp. AN02str TaxID=3423363 RepID=UPI003D31A6A5
MWIDRIRALVWRSRFWWGGVLVGVALVVSLGALRAHAASTVLLQYRDDRQSLPISDLQAFANEGALTPALQQFLDAHQVAPAKVRDSLTAKIPARLESVLPEEFMLLQINKTVGDSLPLREDVDSLKTALQTAVKRDGTFSLMDVLEHYPQRTVRLSVNNLEQAYQDVNLFVSRVEPMLNVVRKLLPELVCNCDAANADPSAPSGGDNLRMEPGDEPGNESAARRAVYGQLQQGITALLLPKAQAQTVEPLRTGTAQTTSQDLKQERPERDRTPSTPQPIVPPLDPEMYGDRQLVFTFGPLRPSITVGELTTFAETGELSRGWRNYLRLARINPTELQEALTRPIAVDVAFLDTALNSLLGEFLLFEVGQIIRPTAGRAVIQATRSTLVLSAADDGHFSMLELLQRYPTQQIQVNGMRLARLGRRVGQLESGGVTAAALSLEDWLLRLQTSAAASICDCNQATTEEAVHLSASPLLSISPEARSRFLPANWQPIPAHREDRGIVKVVWLQGTPYEMGYQHGQLLRDEIASLGPDPIRIAQFVGRGFGMGRLAANRTYADVMEECRGLVDATEADLGITLDVCAMMAYADVFQEVLGYVVPHELFWDGCNQFVATNDATVDGHLYHGNSVDNSKPIDYVMNHPVIFVRQPNEGLPHVFVTYPGVVWPNSGMNVAGLTLGLDTARPNNTNELSLVGRSNVQIMAKILETATNFEEARSLMESQPRVRANLIMISDGKSKQAGVFEFTGRNMGVRSLQDNGVLYVTNHFELPDMYQRQELPPQPSSLSRFARFQQLLEPDQPTSYYGKIDPAVMSTILRDRIDPFTLQASPPDVFDDDVSIGGNGALRQAIYDPERLLVWVAAGNAPVPQNPFLCFSVGELLGFPDAVPCPSPGL